MNKKEKVSVVVCVKNEEKRLEECLVAVMADNPDEVVVVDGNSSDNTVKIAKKFTDRVIVSKAGCLTMDRQVGIDAAKYDLIAMIDADHRIVPGDIQNLVADLKKYDFDIVQSQIISYKNLSFWNSAEEEWWDVVQNIPGPRVTIGTAPALYKKKVFDTVKFDGHITAKMDDIDFIYRARKAGIKFGIGETRIRQLHFGDYANYKRKFHWYGYGDAEFCHKNPERIPFVLFHLLFRYPIIYSARGLAKGKFRVPPYCVAQSALRLQGAFKYMQKQLWTE